MNDKGAAYVKIASLPAEKTQPSPANDTGPAPPWPKAGAAAEPQIAEPLAPWLGGKRHLARTLAGIIAAIPHRVYCEPFLGMGGVFLRRHRAAPIEIINDINSDVVTLFRVVQRHPGELERQIRRWPLVARAEFDRLKAIPPETLTDIERAARFLYLQRQAFGGRTSNPSFGVALDQGTRLKASAVFRQIDRLHERLAGVVIENLPWAEVLKRYDRPETLFYLDPPYWGCETDYGAKIFRRGEFELMAIALRQLKGRFVLSLNDVPQIRDIFAGFSFTEVSLNYSAGSSSGAGKAAAELIIRDKGSNAAGPLFGWN